MKSHRPALLTTWFLLALTGLNVLVAQAQPEILGNLPVGAIATNNPHQLPDGLYTEITTEHGVVVCELFYTKTPLTVASYVGLAEGTLGPQPRKPFYEGLTWHRVVPGFVVQGGDPAGTGDGGPGYSFPDEIVPGLHHDSAGVLQMANDGPDSNGSQYCLMLSPQPHLNYLHTIFGHVVRGLDVLPHIQQGDTMHVKILRLGVAAQAFHADNTTFAALLAKANRYGGTSSPGTNSPFDDPDKLLPTDWPRADAYNFKLSNFERFTGTRVAARIFARSPVAVDYLDTWMQSEAARLNTGTLAIYCADQDRWHLVLGKDATVKFNRNSPATGATVEKFLAITRQESDQAFARAAAKATSEKPLPAGQNVKFKVDAVLDDLLFRLEP